MPMLRCAPRCGRCARPSGRSLPHPAGARWQRIGRSALLPWPAKTESVVAEEEIRQRVSTLARTWYAGLNHTYLRSWHKPGLAHRTRRLRASEVLPGGRVAFVRPSPLPTCRTLTSEAAHRQSDSDAVGLAERALREGPKTSSADGTSLPCNDRASLMLIDLTFPFKGSNLHWSRRRSDPRSLQPAVFVPLQPAPTAFLAFCNRSIPYTVR